MRPRQPRPYELVWLFIILMLLLWLSLIFIWPQNTINSDSAVPQL